MISLVLLHIMQVEGLDDQIFIVVDKQLLDDYEEEGHLRIEGEDELEQMDYEVDEPVVQMEILDLDLDEPVVAE